MKHPYPFIAWDVDWPFWRRTLPAIIWNALVIAAAWTVITYAVLRIAGVE